MSTLDDPTLRLLEDKGFVWHVQTVELDKSLQMADYCIKLAKVFGDFDEMNRSFKLRKFAYLNRACELAGVPLAQYHAESSNGDLDLVWITYRPEAILNNPGSIPDVLVYLDSVDNMNEDQARSRALGY